MIRVILESPCAGATAADVERNRRYLTRALRDSLTRGEAPFASQAIYPGALDDADPFERAIGMAAGFAWYGFAARTVVYVDHGVSRGMQAGVDDANRSGRPVEYRRIGVEP